MLFAFFDPRFDPIFLTCQKVTISNSNLHVVWTGGFIKNEGSYPLFDLARTCFFSIPGLSPFSGKSKSDNFKFKFTRGVDWGFHKK
jgi:hypothetical protein